MSKMTGFKYYNGTKLQFIESGLATTHKDAIVFIKGNGDAKQSCIFAQGTYFANFSEFLNAINFVKGVKVGSSEYNATAGGGYIPFASKDNSTVALDVSNGTITVGLTEEFVNKVNNTATNLGTKADAADKDGSAFARIANLAALVSDLTGGSTGSIEAQITAAINTLRTQITGDLSDTTDAKTLEGINDELNVLDAAIKSINEAGYITINDVTTEIGKLGGSKDSGDSQLVKVSVTTKGGQVDSVTVSDDKLDTALASKANLDENNKIVVSQLPDFILGQMLFGGIVTAFKNGTMTIEPSSNFTSRFGSVTTISASDASSYDGVYFITNTLMTQFAGENYVVGDWVVSVGTGWKKVDNTDAVASVAGLTGAITAQNLASKLAESSVTGALATKEEVNAVGVTAEGDDYVSISANGGRTLVVQATGTLISAVNNANSAYQKPTAGIPKADLASAVQTSLDKAEAAAPQSTTYTKTEVDNTIANYYTKTEIDAMWAWEEL